MKIKPPFNKEEEKRFCRQQTVFAKYSSRHQDLDAEVLPPLLLVSSPNHLIVL